jgi:hypothetical protein
MDIEPRWTKRIILNGRARDPLGLSTLSEFLVSDLLPGFTVMTSYARNYVFYCWAIQQANKTNSQSYRQFTTAIEKLESAYVDAGLLDRKEFFPDAKGPIGKIRGLTSIQNTDNDLKDVNFSILKRNGGGYGAYYRSPMFKLGLTVQLQKNDDLISDGTHLAECFEENIKDTRYFQNYLQMNSIPTKILKEYGEYASYLRLKDFKKEKEKLLAILFNDNENFGKNRLSRKATLFTILDLFNIYSKLDCNFDDTEFRNLIYYQQSKKDDQIVKYSPSRDYVRKTILQWRFFQFQEYFTHAVESIFITLLDALEESQAGLTIPDFVNMNSKFHDEINNRIEGDTENSTINEIIEKMLFSEGIEGKLDKKTSECFDKNMRIDNKNSELNLSIALEESLKEKNSNKTIGLSFLLLFTIIIRYWQYLDTVNDDNFWIVNKEENENSLRKFIRKYRTDFSKMRLLELFEATLRDIVEIHDEIGYEKFRAGNDTFRIRWPHDKNLFLIQGYEAGNRSDRFNSIRGVFEDVGFIEKNGDIFLISEYGEQFLEGLKNEQSN